MSQPIINLNKLLFPSHLTKSQFQTKHLIYLQQLLAIIYFYGYVHDDLSDLI